MNPLSKGLVWKYQKNRYLIASLLARNAPRFVYARNAESVADEIPVFTFHLAFPEQFEEQCLHIVNNGYRTLSAGEFYSVMKSPQKRVEKSIVLTFDDGLKHVWTVAYPLLKKYNLKAICFLIPGCIGRDEYRVRPTLIDYWNGQASLKEVVALDPHGSQLATWEEIRIMNESGCVDFQSHTMYHSLVFSSSEIVDFVHPGYDRHFYGNIHIPLYARDGRDIVSRDAVDGMPIYFGRPRMSAPRRYFDDEELRDRCIKTVEEMGSKHFFSQSNWRRILRRTISEYRAKTTVKERYEAPVERDKAVYEELMESKELIETKLPGKKVTHLCYPWYEAAEFAVEASRRAGFQVNYFGEVEGRPTNRPGDDLFKIVRVEDVFIQRLPGEGRDKVLDTVLRLRKLHDVKKAFGLT